MEAKFSKKERGEMLYQKQPNEVCGIRWKQTVVAMLN